MKKNLVSMVIILMILLMLSPVTSFAVDSGDYQYTDNGDGTVTITNYKGNESVVSVPATLDGKAVTAIAKDGFKTCSSITSLTIPEGVKTISGWAINNCSKLTTINLPSTLENITGEAIVNCYNLATINVDSGSTSFVIQDGVLYDYAKTKLIRYPVRKSGTTYTIPNTVTKIGRYAFNDTLVKSITIPSGVTSIGESAFMNNLALTSVNFEPKSSLSAVKSSTFQNCQKLASITLPDSVKTIEDNSFYGCTALEKIVVLGDGITINGHPFYNCTALKEVVLLGEVTTLSSTTFNTCNSLTKVYCKPGSPFVTYNYATLTSTPTIIENNAPVVNNVIPDQEVVTNTKLEYTFNANTFSDTDMDVLTYTTSTLPSWLSFNSDARTFSGTPTALGTITVTVTASDGKYGKIDDTFDIVVRNANTDATLSDLKIDGKTIESFSSSTETYNVQLPYETTVVPKVTATNTDSNGSAKVTQATALPGTTTVVVTAEDGNTIKTYTINFTVSTANTDATLSALSMSQGTLNTAFNSTTTSYTTSVANSVSSITITPTVNDANATVTVQGTGVTNGSASGNISLNVGSNTITIVGTAQDKTTTKTYTIIVTRAAQQTSSGSNYIYIPDSNNTTVTVKPTTKVNGNKTTVAVELKTKANNNGATVKVSRSTGNKLVKEAKDAKKDGQEVMVEIAVDTKDGDVNTVELTLPNGTVKDLAKGTDADVKLNTTLGTITLDNITLNTISDNAKNNDINVAIEKVDNDTLLETTKQIVGDRPVYDFTVSAGKDTLSDFGGGTATISVSYDLKEDEDPNAVVVYYITDSGDLERVKGLYNTETGTVEFVTTHFSNYLVGYNEVIFDDVNETVWYKDAVTYLAAREITDGTSETTFSPNKTISRAEFVTLLVRYFNFQSFGTDLGYTDIKENMWYTDSVWVAREMDILPAMYGDKFEPNKAIAREEMMYILHKALIVSGNDERLIDKGMSLNDFVDSGSISDYAIESTKYLVSRDIIHGSNGKINPTETTTRAEVAQMLYNMIIKLNTN